MTHLLDAPPTIPVSPRGQVTRNTVPPDVLIKIPRNLPKSWHSAFVSFSDSITFASFVVNVAKGGTLRRIDARFIWQRLEKTNRGLSELVDRLDGIPSQCFGLGYAVKDAILPIRSALACHFTYPSHPLATYRRTLNRLRELTPIDPTELLAELRRCIAIDAAAMPKGPPVLQKPVGSHKQRGRPTSRNEVEDKRMFEQWDTRAYHDYADLRDRLYPEKTVKDIRRAINSYGKKVRARASEDAG